jgi:signal transduction histidine kinase
VARHRGEIGLVDPETGQPFPVGANAGKVHSEHGEILGVVTILHDRREDLEKARLCEPRKEATGQLEDRVRGAAFNPRTGRLSISVEDTGNGIAEEDKDRIFEDFRQVESSLARNHGGAGLGLTISRRLARMLGGEIVVNSSPGEGSVFTLVLSQRPSRRR